MAKFGNTLIGFNMDQFENLMSGDEMMTTMTAEQYEAITADDAQELAETLPVKTVSLYQALSAAQAEMTKAKKDSINYYSKKYADLASVQDACMPALLAHGFAVIQPTAGTAENPVIRTIFIHGPSGQSIHCDVPMLFALDMQKYGSAMTYARRYGLMTLAGIAPSEDDPENDDGQQTMGQGGSDWAAQKSTKKPEPPPEPITDRTRTAINNAVNTMDCFTSFNVFETWFRGYKKKEIDDATEDEGKKLLTFFLKNPLSSEWPDNLQLELTNAIEADQQMRGE